MRQVLALILALVATALVFSQSPPGGCGPGAGDWQVSFERLQGETKTEVWRYNPTTGNPENLHYRFDWQTGLWTENGIGIERGVMVSINGTLETRTVEASDKGSLRLKVKWVGQGPPPTEIPVAAVNFANIAGTGSFSGSVDNGLGSEEVWWHAARSSCSTPDGALRIFDINSQTGEGHIDINVDVSASSTDSGGNNCQASGVSITLSIDDRIVTLVPSPGLTFYKKSVTGATVAGMLGFTYQEAVPVATAIRHSALYTTVFDVDYGIAPGEVVEPLTGLIRHLDYIGSATSRTGTETYNYEAMYGHDMAGFLLGGTASLSGTLPQNGLYSLPNFRAHYWRAVQQRQFLPPNRIKDFHVNEDTLDEEVELKYQWADGVVGKAKLDIEFHHSTDHWVTYATYPEPKEKVSDPGVSEDPLRPGYQYLDPEWRWRQPKAEYDAGDGWAHNTTDGFISNVAGWDMKWFAVASGGLGVLSFGLSFNLPIWAMICTGAGLAVDLVALAAPDPKDIIINREGDMFQKACRLGGDWIVPNPPAGVVLPTNQMTQYRWKAYHRHLHERQFKVGDSWGNQGYAGQVLGEESPPFDYDMRQQFYKQVILP